MKMKASHKIALAIFFLVIILINIYLIQKRKELQPVLISKEVQTGNPVNYLWAKSDKEILFWYIKPDCGTCVDNRKKINQLALEYSDRLKITGICSAKYVSEKDTLENYKFCFSELNREKVEALHLAYTPMAVMVKNQKVTFSFKFDAPFEEEFSRLQNYLKYKYDN